MYDLNTRDQFHEFSSFLIEFLVILSKHLTNFYQSLSTCEHTEAKLLKQHYNQLRLAATLLMT